MDIAVYLTCLIPILVPIYYLSSVIMTFLRNESLQLSISVVCFFFVFFLQMHKSLSPINVVQLTFDYYCCLGRFLRLSWYLNYVKL